MRRAAASRSKQCAVPCDACVPCVCVCAVRVRACARARVRACVSARAVVACEHVYMRACAIMQYAHAHTHTCAATGSGDTEAATDTLAAGRPMVSHHLSAKHSFAPTAEFGNTGFNLCKQRSFGRTAITAGPWHTPMCVPHTHIRMHTCKGGSRRLTTIIIIIIIIIIAKVAHAA